MKQTYATVISALLHFFFLSHTTNKQKFGHPIRVKHVDLGFVSNLF